MDEFADCAEQVRALVDARQVFPTFEGVAAVLPPCPVRRPVSA